MAAFHPSPGEVGMLIRPLTIADRPVIAEMLAQCGAFSAEEIRVALERLDEGLTRPTSDGYVLIGAEAEARVRGYLCVGAVPLTTSTWDIYWICVHPAALRRGIARALMDHAQDYVRQMGGKRLVAQTSGRAQYAPAHKLYVSLGYELVGRIPDYFSDDDDGLFFCKVI